MPTGLHPPHGQGADGSCNPRGVFLDWGQCGEAINLANVTSCPQQVWDRAMMFKLLQACTNSLALARARARARTYARTGALLTWRPSWLQAARLPNAINSWYLQAPPLRRHTIDWVASRGLCAPPVRSLGKKCHFPYSRLFHFPAIFVTDTYGVVARRLVYSNTAFSHKFPRSGAIFTSLGQRPLATGHQTEPESHLKTRNEQILQIATYSLKKGFCLALLLWGMEPVGRYRSAHLYARPASCSHCGRWRWWIVTKNLLIGIYLADLVFSIAGWCI